MKELAKAVLLRAFLDSVGHLGSHGAIGHNEMGMLKGQAKDFIDPSKKQFKLICEHAGTEPDYIMRLYDNLQYNYNSGKITKEKLKFGISRLELKI